MREFGVALNAAAAEVPNDTDAEYLRASVWPEVVAVAGGLARVMVANDLRELAMRLNKAAVPDPCQVMRGITGNTGDQGNGSPSPDTASSQVSPATVPERP
jgi:hypothetical protein